MKYQATITRDIVRQITMGALVSVGAEGKEIEIAPARTVTMPLHAGASSEFRTKRQRDQFVASINAEHPGAAVPA